MNVWTFSEDKTIIFANACLLVWDFGVDTPLILSIKLYLEICGGLLCVVLDLDRLVNLQEFSRQPLGHHMFTGVRFRFPFPADFLGLLISSLM